MPTQWSLFDKSCATCGSSLTGNYDRISTMRHSITLDGKNTAVYSIIIVSIVLTGKTSQWGLLGNAKNSIWAPCHTISYRRKIPLLSYTWCKWVPVWTLDAPGLKRSHYHRKKYTGSTRCKRGMLPGRTLACSVFKIPGLSRYLRVKGALQSTSIY